MSLDANQESDLYCRRIVLSSDNPYMTYNWSVATALALCLLALCVGFPLELDAQPNQRHMIVSVVDGDGTPVTGLNTTDFEIREDGVSREVLRVEPAGAERQIAILVDTSQAASSAVSSFRRGLTTFVDGMQQGNVISLITFGGPPRIRVESTDDAARLRDSIDGLFAFPDQAAYLLDAINQTADGFARRNASRPIILALTTEGVDYSNSDARRVLEQIDEIGASLYTLSLRVGRNAFLPSSSISSIELRNQQVERDLLFGKGPSDSGGRHRDLLADLAIEPALEDIVTELRNQYLVVYSRPDALIPPEEIKINPTRQGLTARGTPLRVE